MHSSKQYLKQSSSNQLFSEKTFIPSLIPLSKYWLTQKVRKALPNYEGKSQYPNRGKGDVTFLK